MIPCLIHIHVLSLTMAHLEKYSMQFNQCLPTVARAELLFVLKPDLQVNGSIEVLSSEVYVSIRELLIAELCVILHQNKGLMVTPGQSSQARSLFFLWVLCITRSGLLSHHQE